MIVLTRKSGQSVTLGHPDGLIEVYVKKNGNRIRVAIDAPKSVPITRGEIAEKRLKESSTSARSVGTSVPEPKTLTD